MQQRSSQDELTGPGFVAASPLLPYGYVDLTVHILCSENDEPSEGRMGIEVSLRFRASCRQRLSRDVVTPLKGWCHVRHAVGAA